MKKVIHVIISLLYIIWGITAPLTALDAILELNIPMLLTAVTGIIMLLAGIFGLFRIKPLKRRIFGIIIFVLAAASAATSLMSGNLALQPIVSALMAWAYIIW